MTAVLPAHSDSTSISLVSITAADIDAMPMADRLRFLDALRAGPATALGVGDRWRNLGGVVKFFDSHGLGAPGSWISLVNAGVLETVAHGLALAEEPAPPSGPVRAAQAWADYIADYRAGKLHPRAVHDKAWGHAKRVTTDYGVHLAEQEYRTTPTDRERRFLILADLYNWLMRNRELLDAGLAWAGLLDRRLRVIDSAFVDAYLSVGDSEVTRLCCELAWDLAGTGASTDRDDLVKLAFRHLPGILLAAGRSPLSR